MTDRRTVLRWGGATAATLAAGGLSGCGALSLEPDVPQTPVQRGPKGPEAPMLAERVAAGDLPPVGERLPERPTVVEPVEGIGRYGGTFRSAMIGAISIYQAYTHTAYDALMMWDPEWTRPMPDLARSVEVGDGGRRFTFRLRPGTRWSDGHPFTADDILFAYHDVMSNPDLMGAPPPFMLSEGAPAELEKLDDHTFQWTFAQPNGLLLSSLASPEGYVFTLYPKHHLSRYHADYNPDVAAEAEEAGFASWGNYFFSKVGQGYWDLPRWQNPDLPTLSAWCVTSPFGTGAQVVLERNPYYWKVDPEGSQLPYIDRVTFDVVGDPEVMLIKAANGEVEFPQSDIYTIRNKPVLAAGRERGGYHFVDAVTAEMNQISICLNQNTKDAALREIFALKDFRVALSHAINREEIITAVFQRQGEPWQLAPRRESPFFDEEMAKQYTEYDPARAEELLDAAGLRLSGSGTRRSAAGRALRFEIAVVTQQPDQANTLDLIAGYWRRIGVDMRVRVMDRSLFYQLKGVNELDVTARTAGGGLLDALYDPRLFFPFNDEASWAPLWATWYLTGGAEGEEPPRSVRRQMEIYDRIRTTLDPERQYALMRDILAIARDDFYNFGVALPAPAYTIISDRLRNFPADYPVSFYYPTPGPMRPEQFYYEEA
jgi:ABC-type transport system substrate-binding protein